MVDMSSIHLRNALSLLEELLRREDVDGGVKELVAQARKEIVAAQDELLWARGRAKEAFYVLEELVELLGAEVRGTRARLLKDVVLKQVEASPHVEAVVSEEGKVKIEKVAVR
ncbi:MAG: hypothetical protein DRJ96_06120 [Thermoprotei archaeon]|nr:hypothetical protein [Thermoproteales archaeon]RLE87874.1 MAG: hypothetical protein DRJ67_03630 [Thermoprotei archaeon]RLE96593.1 MAG: hypothetical protein DRJ96_06120 [Thermoprotei archaeon]